MSLLTSQLKPNYRGVDFDDDELPFYEENKSKIKVCLFRSQSPSNNIFPHLSPRMKNSMLS
jgi:hypothetical protein